VDISAEAFAKAAQSVAENTPRALEAVAKWQSVQLPQATRVEFARRAAALRWDADQPVMKLLSPEKLLTPVRNGELREAHSSNRGPGAKPRRSLKSQTSPSARNRRVTDIRAHPQICM